MVLYSNFLFACYLFSLSIEQFLHVMPDYFWWVSIHTPYYFHNHQSVYFSKQLRVFKKINVVLFFFSPALFIPIVPFSSKIAYRKLLVLRGSFRSLFSICMRYLSITVFLFISWHVWKRCFILFCFSKVHLAFKCIISIDFSQGLYD